MKTTPTPVSSYNDESYIKTPCASQKEYEVLFSFDMSENVDNVMKHSIRNETSHVLKIDLASIGLIQTNSAVRFVSVSALFTITSGSQDASKHIQKEFTIEKLNAVLQRASDNTTYAKNLVYFINYVSDKEYTNDNLKWYLMGIAIFLVVGFAVYFIFQIFNNQKIELHAKTSILPKL